MFELLLGFLESNSVLVWFVYGLMFFVLGLAITLRSRAHSRLELAQHLNWLAAFGFLHGLHEWGDLFIPIQATYLPASTINILNSLQTLLLAASFAALFQFSAEVLHDRWPALRILPLLLSIGWLAVFPLTDLVLHGDIFTNRELAAQWASYAIGFPGALLSAIGLHYQVQKQIKPLHLKRIERPFLVASYALVAYAFLDGLIMPSMGTIATWLSGPNGIWNINPAIIRSISGMTLALAGLTLAVAVIRALDVFQIEVDRLIEQMRVERELIYERDRIGRDLHDGAIQTIYTAGLLVETVSRKLTADNELLLPLERAGKAINEAIADLRSFIGGLRPPEVPQSLRKALAERAKDDQFSSLVNIEWDLDLPDDLSFQATRVPHVMGILTEALSNAIRHAKAGHIRVRAYREDSKLHLLVEDDGRGFDKHTKARGFGLRNMQDRARLLDGDLQIHSQPGRGTKIVLSAPWEMKL